MKKIDAMLVSLELAEEALTRVHHKGEGLIDKNKSNSGYVNYEKAYNELLGIIRQEKDVISDIRDKTMEIMMTD